MSETKKETKAETETVENSQTKAETKTKTEKPKIERQEGTAKPAIKSAAVKSVVSKGTKHKQGKFTRVDY